MQILEKSLEFWQYKSDLLTLQVREKIRAYPPKVTLEWDEDMSIERFTVFVRFSGIKLHDRDSDELKDTINLPPKGTIILLILC